MEEIYMTQEEFNESVKIGDIIETDLGEKLRCVSIEGGVPQWEATTKITMDFGEALKALKDGRKVARMGWNGNRPIKIPDYPFYVPSERVEYREDCDLVYLLLSDGSVAVCDGCFYDKVKGHNWSMGSGYAYITDNGSVPRRSIKLHNFILEHTPSDVIVDHINGNKLDNRLINLRIATHKENKRNSGGKRNSTSSYKGVSWDSSRNKWIASIQYGGKTHHIGRFDDEVECAKAYDKACMRIYGAYAKLNFDYDFIPNTFLWLKPATEVKAEWCKDPLLRDLAEENGGSILALGTICMYTHDSTGRKAILTGWLASQSDMLLEDWVIVD